MSTLMYRVAEEERRRGWLWGSTTAIIISLLYQVMSSTYLPPFVGLIVAFLLMTVANIYKPADKGPFM